MITPVDLKLGKKPAVPEQFPKLKFRNYANLSVLPTPPVNFGHDDLVKNPWGMLGNDKYGCCAIAGPGHQIMLWNAEAGRQLIFSDQNTLADYSAITGFNANDPTTDQGTAVPDMCKYFKITGLLDAAGIRHKVGAYLEIEKGNVEEHLTACYLFGSVGIGVQFPASAMSQFNSHQPWTVITGSQVDGGHYIPQVSRRSGVWNIVTWGSNQLMEDDFFVKYNDESVVFLSEEFLTNGKSLEGFDLEQLNNDLNQLTTN